MSSLAAAAGFDGCFPSDPLPRFWQDPSYISSNPNILTIWSVHSYAFSFDNSTQSLGLENASLMNGSTLLARVPVGQRSALSEAAALLTRASGELALAKEAELSSHGLSAKAQSAIRDNFGLMNIPLTNVFFLSALVHLDILMKVSDVSSFVSLYPAQYSATLEHAASAHDSLQSAALSISRLVQAEYEFLSVAGAGSQNYSGAASSPFNYAESLLAKDGGFCANEAAAYRKAYAYFASSPRLPDFSQAGFPSRLNALCGSGENSSIARALSLYLLLSDAKSKMLAEYSTAQLSAQDASRALSSEISLLGSEKLEMIGDTPSIASGSTLVIGSGYNGIYSGYLNAKEDSSRAQSLLSSSQASFSSKEADNWLSQSISEAQASAETSQTALASLRLVRSNAEAAVLSSKNAAEAAISSAQGSSGASASSLASAQSLSSARSILTQAEDSFAAAGSLPSLGARYQAYTNAARLADRSCSLSQSQQATGALSEAGQALSKYSSLISSARTDGIDVAYEQETFSEYRALLSSSPSADVISAVISSVESEQHSLLLRVYETYSYLEEKYASALEISDAMREFAPSLPQQLGPLSRYFPSGMLEPEAAVGHLKQAERSLDSILLSCEQQKPQYLSFALSQNSHAAEIYEMPVLGRQTDYTAYITTKNPSSLSSYGSTPFTVRTTVPIYSSDFSSGDALSDAYPDKGKTTIVLSSVQPLQAFSFTFMKKDQPVQIISSDDSCLFASDELAQASRTIDFISSRPIPALLISQMAPAFSNAASAAYSGQKFPLSSFSSGEEDELRGEMGGVASGKGELGISYSVSHPFTTSLSTREYEALPLGAKNVSYTLSLSPSSIGCPSATIFLNEPYTGIANLSITPLSGEKVVRASATASGSETQLSLTFSPLAKGKAASFAVSFILQDTAQALSEAFSQSEILVLTYNRTRDALMLSEAKSLASQGKDSEALALLSQLRKEAQELSYSDADYQLFLQEKSEAVSALSSLAPLQSPLLLANSSSQTAFSSALFKYQSSLSSASDEADAGGYQKAVTILRKAKTDLFSSLAALSLSSLASASEKYAAWQKQGTWNSTLLLDAQGELSDAQSYYTQGEFAQSLLHSSEALSGLSSLAQASSDSASGMAAQADALRSDYSALRAEVEPLLANYSFQYAALSTQSRRQLPFTPAQAQSRLDDADKLLAASKKSSLSSQDALQQANSSYAKLASLHTSLSDALASLASSASASLGVARAALSEVKSRASAEDAQQIGDEVAHAENFLASAMYADSLASSDRAISAANAALSKSSGASPLQPIALALISVAFLAAAAYYFFAGKKRAKPEEKKEVPKAE
ncbi:MAG: hypothetical protein NTX79_02330 [Candidatus Micrarchaeota archaeon]|nr:hypothetical protein [Candidatus Micrarchaeota archaeon]